MSADYLLLRYLLVVTATDLAGSRYNNLVRQHTARSRTNTVHDGRTLEERPLLDLCIYTYYYYTLSAQAPSLLGGSGTGWQLGKVYNYASVTVASTLILPRSSHLHAHRCAPTSLS